jgi:hypothetical protein
MQVSEKDSPFFYHLLHAFRYIEQSAQVHTQWVLPMSGQGPHKQHIQVIRSVNPNDPCDIRMEARVMRRMASDITELAGDRMVFAYVLKPNMLLAGPMYPPPSLVKASL